MKFLYKEVDQVLEWDEHVIPTLIIENKITFNKVVTDLYGQINDGYEGNCKILDVKDKSVIKSTKLILEPFSISLNNKEIANYVSNFILDKMKETHSDLDRKLKPIYDFIKESYLELPIDIEVGEVFNQKNLAKVFPITVYDDSESIVERLTSFLRSMTEFGIATMYVFVNLKHYLTEDEYSNFAFYVLNQKINVLLIENKEQMKIQEEKSMIIDDDLCIIE